jgi:hypothetical protein
MNGPRPAANCCAINGHSCTQVFRVRKSAGGGTTSVVSSASDWAAAPRIEVFAKSLRFDAPGFSMRTFQCFERKCPAAGKPGGSHTA